MKIFAGPNKKSTAGITFALSIFFISSFAHSNTAETLVPPSATASSSAASSAANQALATSTLENSNIAAQTPVTINSSATAPKPNLPPQTTSSASQLASLLGGLVLILVLIYGLSWFVKRFSQGGFMQNPSMKIVSAMPLGTRERLMLVDVGGKQLLLGVTATHINTLHVFDEPVVSTEKSQPVTSDFSQKLMAILQQKPVASPDDSTHKKSNS